MRRRVAQVVLVVALVGVAFALRGRRPTSTGGLGPRETPEAVVKALYEAASRGDDKGYLALAGGEFLTSSLESRKDMGAEAYRESLRRSVEGVKGLAMTRVGQGADGSVTLEVELTFVDRNERQRVVLAPKGRSWVVVAMSRAQRVVPSVPYGTPVFE